MCAFSAVLTTPAHSPEQPAVVSDLSLHERSRRARLHHQCSTTTSDTIFYIAPSSCVRGARISASFHHASRRDRPSTDTARVTTRKISFKPTSRRSSHLRTDQHLPTPHDRTRGRAAAICTTSTQVTQVFGTHRSIPIITATIGNTLLPVLDLG